MSRAFGRRINEWLAEPKDEIFRDGKWRFWFPTLLGLTALNAVMTAVIFGADGMQKYIGSIVVLAGAVLCWLALGLLHYSDSEDRLLAIGVAVLDSVTLLFVAAHFSFLLWCQGHLWTLRAAEEKHRQDLATYNAQVAPISADNARITAAAERIAEIEKQTERIRNDTAYWSKRNGVKPAKSGIKVELSTTKVELPPPPAAPAEASAAFLSKWDSWIRLAGFGELGLSIVTLIFVRTRTAARNRIRADKDFPAELEVEKRSRAQRADLDLRSTDVRTQKSDSARQSCISGAEASGGSRRIPISARDSTDRAKARRKLLEHLKVISHYNPGKWFRADLLVDGGVHIRMSARIRGIEETIAETRQSDKLLAAVDRPDFRERLIEELRRQGFEI